MADTKDYGTFDFDGKTYKLIRDPHKVAKSGAVAKLVTDPRTGWDDNEKAAAGLWRIIELLFSEEDADELLTYDFEELTEALGPTVYGVEQGN